MGQVEEVPKALPDKPQVAASPTRDVKSKDAHAEWISPVPNASIPPQSENPPPPNVYILWGSRRYLYNGRWKIHPITMLPNTEGVTSSLHDVNY